MFAFACILSTTRWLHPHAASVRSDMNGIWSAQIYSKRYSILAHSDYPVESRSHESMTSPMRRAGFVEVCASGQEAGPHAHHQAIVILRPAVSFEVCRTLKVEGSLLLLLERLSRFNDRVSNYAAREATKVNRESQCTCKALMHPEPLKPKPSNH